METIERSIEADVPVSTAYNQWTQFESFPSFMEGVESVQQKGDKRLHWVAKVAGERKEWDAEIIEQVPDQVVSWRSTSGAQNSGTVNFERLEGERCRITVVMTYQPEGVKEKLGDALGVLALRVEGDLHRFKEFIESRGAETGAWRGEIRDGQEVSGKTGTMEKETYLTGSTSRAPPSTAESATGMRKKKESETAGSTGTQRY